MPFSDFLKSLFGRKTPSQPGGTAGKVALSPDDPTEPVQITTARVLLIVYDPKMDGTGKKLSEQQGWMRPEDLVTGFMSDLLQASGGMVRYQIAQRIDVDEFPVLTDGFRYTPQTYLDVLRGVTAAHAPTGADYNTILNRFNILKRVGNNELDEVWLMGFPYAGFFESTMAGAGAFWCNAPPLPNTDSCKRRFVIMGFSYERDTGEMLHSYSHRCESILAKVFNAQDFLTWAYKAKRTPPTIAADAKLNLYERFLCFDQIAPGKAGVGTVHHAPNSTKDYEWGNPASVKSECYDWFNFPDFKGDIRSVTAADWGNGSDRSYQRWWLSHFPKAAGRKGGIHNNWWQYIANPNNVVV
jgi:hypothetical protein